MNNDTIAAISTGLSPAGIGIIRISGEQSFSIIEKIFLKGIHKFYVSKVDSHTVHYGHIVDKNQIIDEVMVVILKAPKTFTKEDIVEINCHGGIFLLKRILEVVLNHGARMAEPGEFTKRAFLNGRLDLAQAESVMDLIHSKNEFARKSSISQLNGNLSKQMREIRQVILHEMAFIESALDDPEHVSLDGYPEQLLPKIEMLIKQIDFLIYSCDNGRLLKDGIQTVIVGKPNVGKSSFLNVLLGQERAIVTDIEGTTRDSIEEQIIINGITLNIIDTAGIRKTEDLIEQIGVKKSREYIDTADLILYMIDGSRPLDDNDHDIIQMLSNKKVIVLVNKSDLEQSIQLGSLFEILDYPIISLSAKDRIGFDEFESKLKELFFHGELNLDDENMVTNIRHKESLTHAIQSLKQVKNSIENQMPEDFFTIDLSSAFDSIGEITGDSVGDDLVKEIFSKFCTGK